MKNIRNKNAPPNADLVQVYLSSSWDVITDIYKALPLLTSLAEALANGDLDNFLTAADIDTLAELNAIVTDATFGDFASQAQAEAGTDNATTMTPLRVAQAIAGGAGILNNFTAITDPLVTDDANSGYVAGSVWMNVDPGNEESWRCSDPTIGAAVWVKTTLTSDELAVVALTGDSDDLIEGIAQLLMTVAERSKLGLIEASATADQTDIEILNAYNNQVAAASQGEMEAGIEAAIRTMSPLRVAQAIAALGGSGGGITWYTKQIEWNDSVNNDGVVFEGLIANTACATPPAAVGTSYWVFNNDPTFRVDIQTAIGGKIAKLGTLQAEVLGLQPGEGGCFICSDAGSPNVWEAVLFNLSSGALLADGSVPLTADWVIGTFALQPTFSGTITPLFSSSADTDTGITMGSGDIYFVQQAGNSITFKSNYVELFGTKGEIVFAEKTDHDWTPLASRGNLWVKNTVPNTLFFTDDDGVDHDLTAGGGGGLTVEFKTVDFTAVAGTKYFVDTTLGPVVVTLPVGGNLDNIKIVDAGHNAVTFNITINPNGAETIDGDTTFVIDQNEGDIDIGYNLANTNWEVSADGSPDLLVVPIAGPVKVRTVRTLIETIDNEAVAGSFDFAIPPGYDRVIIKGNLRADNAVDVDSGAGYINADYTAANYHSQQSGADNGVAAVWESSDATILRLPGTSSPTGSVAQVVIEIEAPDGALNKTINSRYGFMRNTTRAYSATLTQAWNSTAAITNYLIEHLTDPTNKLFGTLTLYGELDEEIGGGAGFEAVNVQTGTTYEFVNADLVDVVTANNAAASTYDIPDGLGNTGGSQLSLLNIGAGEVTITVAGTDTLGSTDNKCITGKAITVLKTTATEWRVIGGSA